MAVKTGLGVCGNAFVHASLSKFFSGSEYSALWQHIGKSPIPISKIQVRLQEWKTPINTILILCWWMTYNFLHYLILLSVSLFQVSSLLSSPTTLRSFSDKVRALSFTLLLKLVINLPPSAIHFSPGNLAMSIYTILSKRLYLILLVMFQLISNIKLFANLSHRFNHSLLMWISHPSVSTC